MEMKRNEILEISFEFALEIIEFCEILEQKRKYVIARQLLKSGTSIGANVREAQNPHSRADFISKLVIAAKEADETEYWLLLCAKSKNYPNPDNLMSKILSIKKILSKIISSSKRNI
ncbi:MAG: four helix bundle protein [Bacteroidetes bacterium]|nr:four helix bundle protein [Bacteroidota bacterium]